MLFFAGSLGVILVMLWPEGDAAWWAKLIHGYGFAAIVLGGLILMIVLGNRRRAKR